MPLMQLRRAIEIDGLLDWLRGGELKLGRSGIQNQTDSPRLTAETSLVRAASLDIPVLSSVQ